MESPIKKPEAFINTFHLYNFFKDKNNESNVSGV